MRRPDHDWLELVRGTLRVCEPPGGVHGSLAAHLASQLSAWVNRHHLGTVLVEAGFVLRRNPDTVRGPDVSFVSHARIPRGRLPVAFIPGAPDLAVEILSPDDRPAEVADRVADYLEAGTKLVWVCDPARRAVTVHRPGLPPETVSSDGWLDGGEVLPGFLCAVWTVLGST